MQWYSVIVAQPRIFPSQRSINPGNMRPLPRPGPTYAHFPPTPASSEDPSSQVMMTILPSHVYSVDSFSMYTSSYLVLAPFQYPPARAARDLFLDL